MNAILVCVGKVVDALTNSFLYYRYIIRLHEKVWNILKSESEIELN